RPPASRHKSGALATVILRGVPLRMTNWAQLRSRELFKEFVLAEKKSGIRINALAKELGIESKAILEKLRAEGLGDSAPNHMSTIPLGRGESVREWFAAGQAGVSTAVQTAPPVEATKAKPRARKKKAAAADEETPGGDVGVAVAEPPVSEAKVTPSR